MNREDALNVITDYLTESGAKRIAIFGSFARGREDASSDIAILVEFADSVSLLRLVRLERELPEKLDTKVDLLAEGSISP